LGRHMFSM
jgi:regulator of replication initiation timing